MIVSPIKSRFLEVKREGTVVTFRFEPQADLTIGSHQRFKQSIRLVKTQLKCVADQVQTQGGCVTARSLNADIVEITNLVSEIDARLGQLRDEKVPIKMLEEVLGVTPRERQRWTKDGRLPAKGNAFIQRGQTIRLWTYSPDVVARLLKHPEIIDGWRKADLAKAAGTTASSEQI
ncbi:hypothetical protein HAP47_0007350 [Bradyrhizobium sp. 41S5]|uniref:hypothetical protein n=1 Tax=Bradyrhizobium sp. 41S5 TaxID=1404443 RepID=UPI00156B2F95|nr:hypothetical protein [Bradyrhizobium sp. 41S5]UFX46491.1 hypothetical protein HAP47_0007350 [Bradyrhizobium sp. 41S5]